MAEGVDDRRKPAAPAPEPVTPAAGIAQRRGPPPLPDTTASERRAAERAAARAAVLAARGPRPRRRPRQPGPPAIDLTMRLRRAWGRHPLVGFFGHRARIAFYRQLHALVKSGQGIPTSLMKLARYAPNAGTRRALQEMQRDVAAGATVGESMRQHAHRFDDAIVELVLFAEDAGKLQEVLEKVIAHQEEMQSLRWQALLASLWPLYLIVALVFVGPLLGLARNASSIGGNWIGAYLSGLGGNLALASLALAVIIGAPLIIAAAGVESAWERFVLGLPAFGRVKRDFIGTRFFLALGLGIEAGVEVKRALRIAVSASGSPTMTEEVPAAIEGVERGSTLTEALEALTVLDNSSLGTLAIGEDTGTLDEQLRGLANDAQKSAVRGARIVMLTVLAAVAIVVLVPLTFEALSIVFGPIREYYTLPSQV